MQRFPSITNEGAVRPHENAFRRWSSPELAETELAPMTPMMDMMGTAPASPFARTTLDAPSPVSTERADTMAAHHPPSFTVYTPDQTRNAPFRKSVPDHDSNDDTVGARTLLKWTGIGIVAGIAVLTALIVVLNFGGDRGGLAKSTVNARSSLMASKTETPKAEAKVVEVPKPATIPAAKTDVEIITTPAPASAKKATTKVAAKKKK